MCPILRLLPSPLKSTNMLISAMCPTLRSIPSQLICPIMLILAKCCWYSFVPYVNSTFSIDLSFSSPTTTIEIANIHAPYFISIRGKWRSYGLSYFLQVSIADKVLKVAVSLFCSGSHRQIAKSFQRRRLSGRELSGNEDSVWVLSFFADRQGFESGVRGKGLRYLETKRLCANIFLKKTEKDF